MRKIIISVLLLASINTNGQSSETGTVLTSSIPVKNWYLNVQYEPLYSDATAWGRCMNNALSGCMAKWYCAAGYSMQPFIYSAAFAMGCAIYSEQNTLKQTKPGTVIN